MWRALGFLVACNDEPTSPDSGAETAFEGDLGPVIAQRCQSCHTDGGIAPFALDTPEQVGAWREAIVDSVTTRRMPPWGMEPDCRGTVGDLRLPDSEIALFQAWADAEFPESATTAPGVPPPPPTSLPPSLELRPALGYTPSASTGSDDYRCQILDHTFAETTFVTSNDALPDQQGEVHHVIAYVVAAEELADVAWLDAQDELPGYPCFGGPGVSAAVIGGWAPGAQPDDQPITVEGGLAAARIPAGAQILLEVHYNTSAVERPTPDRTGLALWTLPVGEFPEWLLFALPIADLGLEIAAGDAESVQELTTRVAIDGRVVGAAPHMHTRGRSLSTRVIRQDGTEVCLSDVPAYDFDWQRQYTYEPDEQVPLTVTDEIQLTCVFDNSAASQIDGEPPSDLTWGESTADEMCLDYLTVATRYTAGDDPAVCAGFGECYRACPPGDGFCFMTCATNAGETCLNCTYDALFGECVTYAHCLEAGTALYFCTLDCDDLDSDYADCLYDDCRAEFDAYYDCFQPVFDAGACPDDLASCAGMAP